MTSTETRLTRLSGFLFAVAIGMLTALPFIGPEDARGQGGAPVTVPLPANLTIPVRVPSVQIVGMTLALPGVSSATTNVIHCEFDRFATVVTNGVTVHASVKSTMYIEVTVAEILAAQTNYTAVSAMPLGDLTPLIYGVAMHKLLDALPYAAAELMKP